MPKTAIVTDDINSPEEVLAELIRKKIVQHCSVNGTNVYGKYYNSKTTLRKAYHKYLPKIRSLREKKAVLKNEEKKSTDLYEEKRVVFINGVPQIPSVSGESWPYNTRGPSKLRDDTFG